PQHTCHRKQHLEFAHGIASLSGCRWPERLVARVVECRPVRGSFARARFRTSPDPASQARPEHAVDAVAAPRMLPAGLAAPADSTDQEAAADQAEIGPPRRLRIRRLPERRTLAPRFPSAP